MTWSILVENRVDWQAFAAVVPGCPMLAIFAVQHTSVPARQHSGCFKLAEACKSI
jgi:hypothetical protein